MSLFFLFSIHAVAKIKGYAKKISDKFAHRVINGGVRHNLPQEAPKAFANAIIVADSYSN